MNLKIFGGPTSEYFAKGVCEFLGVEQGRVEWQNFEDGEREPQFQDSLRGAHVFLIQSTHQPDKNIMNLLMMVDAAKRASAGEITAVIPYFGYGRQDRKHDQRVPITAKLNADLITAAGANRVLTMDLHAAQIQGFFNIPVDHLYFSTVFLDYLKEAGAIDIGLVTVLSADTGGVSMCRSFAQRLGNCPLAITDKRRPKPNKSVVMNIIGDVAGRIVLIFDDLVDTAGTLTKAEAKAMELGALKIMAASAHPVLSGPAIERISKSSLSCLFFSDSIPLDSSKKIEKIKVVSVIPHFANAIGQIYECGSVSSLF